jgi:hypothetical protein
MNSCFLVWIQIRDYWIHTYQEAGVFRLAYEIISLNHDIKSWVGIWNHGLWVQFQPTTWKWIFHGMIQHRDSAIIFLYFLFCDCMNLCNDLNVWNSDLNSINDVFIRINILYSCGCIIHELTRSTVGRDCVWNARGRGYCGDILQIIIHELI